MYVRDVPVTQNIKCIVITDSYGLWINRSQITVFSTNTLWQNCGYIFVVMVIGDIFSPNISQIY